MVWRHIGNKPLSEPMLNRFTDAYMRHLGRGVKINHGNTMFITPIMKTQNIIPKTIVRQKNNIIARTKTSVLRWRWYIDVDVHDGKGDDDNDDVMIFMMVWLWWWWVVVVFVVIMNHSVSRSTGATNTPSHVYSTLHLVTKRVVKPPVFHLLFKLPRSARCCIICGP